MIIRVARSDLGTVAHEGGRIYITGTTPERERARVWMGPESYKNLCDAVREVGAVWCDVPMEQAVKPSRTQPDAFRDRPVDKPGSLVGTVVLVDVDDDDERLYVIPESWARSALRSYATLNFARSYRDVLVDDAAVQTVVDALDGGWGIDYDPTDYLAAENEEQILAELRVLGCEIFRCPGLVRLYRDPDPDLVARVDAGEWPPRGGEPPSDSAEESVAGLSAIRRQ